MNILKINGQALEGIYVDAAISFNKPAKRVSTYSVPGRNGDLVIDEGTFDNVLITYPVFEKSTFPTKFDEIVNYLASLEGYQKIECSNDPQHYRLGRFVVPQNPTAKRLNRDGYWQLSFDCKPQRWLLSGEEDTEIDANPIDEYSGDIVSIDAVALDEITELKAAIEPVQSGSGDPSPTNIRPISGHTEVNVTRTGVNLWDKANVENGYIDDTTGEVKATSPYKNTGFVKVLPNTQYYIKTEQTASAWGAWYDADKRYISGVTSYHTIPLITSPNNASYVRLTIASSGIGDINTFGINYPSSATNYEPFGTTYPISLGQTVYGGTLNVTTGVLTVTHAMVDLGTLTWVTTTNRVYSPDLEGVAKMPPTNVPANMIAEQYKCVAANGTLVLGTFAFLTINGHEQLYFFYDGVNKPTGKLVYELATPTTVQLTAAEVETLFGQNNIWADTGDVEVKVTTPTVFNNPSLFNSKPLIRVYGVGTFRVNDITVTIASHDKPYIDIDCELQECFYGSENMNEYVSFSGNDFPELQPGDNYMLLASGITKLDVTPRWWVL